MPYMVQTFRIFAQMLNVESFPTQGVHDIITSPDNDGVTIHISGYFSCHSLKSQVASFFKRCTKAYKSYILDPEPDCIIGIAQSFHPSLQTRTLGWPSMGLRPLLLMHLAKGDIWLRLASLNRHVAAVGPLIRLTLLQGACRCREVRQEAEHLSRHKL